MSIVNINNEVCYICNFGTQNAKMFSLKTQHKNEFELMVLMGFIETLENLRLM